MVQNCSFSRRKAVLRLPPLSTFRSIAPLTRLFGPLRLNMTILQKPSYWCASFVGAIAIVASLTGCPDSSSPDEPIDLSFYRADHSAARNWNEALLAAIRSDFAKPTVHARNLFHASALMYDLWAVYDASATTYFLGNQVGDYHCEFTDEDRALVAQAAPDIEQARSEAISYAMFRLLSHRFENSPGANRSLNIFRDLLVLQGFDPAHVTTDFSSGEAGALGLYLADCVIAFGLQDGSNEAAGYANRHYLSSNPPIQPNVPGIGLVDANKWQPISLDEAIDQSGNPGDTTQTFLGAEWGNILPFAIPDDVCEQRQRGEETYRVCHDPGPPPLIFGDTAMPLSYQWMHSLVAIWSSHLDPDDGVIWDISPAKMSNALAFPTDLAEYQQFFTLNGNNSQDGGALWQGLAQNPSTGQPYVEQAVPRGDYTRVSAEYWADGPQSETPPGHWYRIANEMVSDHAQVVKKYRGQGEVLSDLEWDVKLYVALGGALHDAAVAAWGIKGWYDYPRPITAIRYMGSRGQSTDPALPNYNQLGLPLVDGYIELVKAGDPLEQSRPGGGQIKVRAWSAHASTGDPGINWILAEEWRPYQRPTFVSPPFAGYVSGHSTFSRAAAEILTQFTGDPFFPGGMAEFVARKDEFLEFDVGPSVDVHLQWATYRDASDHTSLSRIWGGIHPPIDDIPGRQIGINVAASAFAKADALFK